MDVFWGMLMALEVLVLCFDGVLLAYVTQDYLIRPVDVFGVKVDDGFCVRRIELNSRVTVLHRFRMLRKGRYS